MTKYEKLFFKGYCQVRDYMEEWVRLIEANIIMLEQKKPVPKVLKKWYYSQGMIHALEFITREEPKEVKRGKKPANRRRK